MGKEQFNAGHGIDAKTLLRRYADGSATEQERQIFEQWYYNLNKEAPISLTEEELEAAERAMRAALERRMQPGKVRSISYWRRSAVAAALLLLMAGAYLLLWRKAGSDAAHTSTAAVIQPGRNTATLTLADGRVVQLSEAKSGVVIDAASLAYSDGTALDTALAAGVGTAGNVLLTASTPRGGTYQFILDDGTKVWLNADSKLQFTAVFKGPERKVILTGEAFFEVAKDAKRPFVVATHGQELKVLGTSFNINSYTDEPAITTTLIDGSVQVAQAGNTKAVVLQPGQQSLCTQSAIQARAAAISDIEQAVAWKNGDFVFDADIRTIMKQIARWYDVDISYKGPIPTEEFGGKIARSKSIKQVLRVLESTNSVHFEIKERRITVMK